LAGCRGSGRWRRRRRSAHGGDQLVDQLCQLGLASRQLLKEDLELSTIQVGQASLKRRLLLDLAG
jgi:hypothetical protein